MVQQLIQQVTAEALPGLVAILAALGSLALAAGTRFILAHTKNTVVQGTLIRLETLVATVVSESEQTMVADLTKDGAPLTKEAGEKILADTLAKLQAHLGPKGLAEIEAVLKPADLQAMLISFIESEVAKQTPTTVVKVAA